MLKFIVNGQTLNRIDLFSPVEKSINYLTAGFIFSKDWDGLDKKAICKAAGQSEEFDAHIEDNVCRIPWEVISQEGSFDICVKGTGDDIVLTTSIVTVDIGDTLIGGSESNPPSETEVEWMRRQVLEMEDTVKGLEEKIAEGTLVVTLNDEMTMASHSASEIMEHVMAGGEAVFDLMGMMRLPYVMYLDDEAVGGAMFSTVAFTGKAAMIALIVRDDKSILPLDAMLVTPEDIDSVIPTALPNPRELLINGTRYDGSRSVSVVTNQHLIVTTADMQTASHSAGEIRRFVQQNFDVSLDCAGMFRLPYVADADGQCVFAIAAGMGGEATVVTLRVDENKAVTMEQFMLGTREQFEELIPEKLPNPNALTINGTSYDGTQAVNLEIGGGGGYSYAELVDDITVNEEGLTEIVLNLDLQQCNEARIYTYTPATGLTTNYLYNLTFRDGTYQQRLCDMSAFANNTTCSAAHYRALTEEYGEVLCATGMAGGNLNELDKTGGSVNLQASKAPRIIRSGLKFVSGNKTNFKFPIGMRIMTFAWKK